MTQQRGKAIFYLTGPCRQNMQNVKLNPATLYCLTTFTREKYRNNGTSRNTLSYLVSSVVKLFVFSGKKPNKTP